MKKVYFSLVTILVFTICSTAQNNYEEFWDQLLSNNRIEAEKLIEKNKSNDIEWLLANEILKNEKGRIKSSKSFLKDFLSKDEYEYYLYAFWNKSFLFQDYLDDGFNNKIYKVIDEVSKKGVSHIDLQDALTYLKSVKSRSLNDWKTYYELNSKINSIKQWQYCGSFENLNESGLDKTYEPETISNNDVLFDARSNGKLGWYNGTNSKEAYQFFTNHNEYGSGVNYAQTFINSTIDQRIFVRIGSGSAFKVFINDVEVYKNDKDIITDLNAYGFLVNLPKGNNRLLVKIAESNSNAYFLLSLFDENKKPLNTISVSNEPVPYNTSEIDKLNPIDKENDFEAFFKDKIRSNPKNFLYHFSLYATYIRNSRYEEARNVLMPYYKKYPKSSFLRNALMDTYNIEEDYTSSNELNENIERDDPDYYLPILNKISDYGELSRLTMDEFDEYILKLKNAFDLELIKASADFISYARKQDVNGIKKTLDNINAQAIEYGNNKFRLEYAAFYDKLFQDQDKTISILEDIVKNSFDLGAQNQLISYYEDKNQKKKSTALVVKDYENLSTDNIYLKRIVNNYIRYQKYDKALPYANEMLKNYPYSFTSMELKADILKQLGKTDEALALYEKALSHNSGDSQLRKKINDISKKQNLLNELVLEDAYDYIKANRNKITTNNYGFNILLDDNNTEIFEEGGFKYRNVYIYEITSNNGVETFKEYDLGVYGSYKMIKSELVKPNGNVVPADRSGSRLVFNDISIGDVIYVDYEGIVTSTGRFYKDISDKMQLYSFHPLLLSSMEILVPDSVELQYRFMNGDLKPQITKIQDYNLYKWEVKNPETLKFAEDYMPNSTDHVGYLHYSTIRDWNEISVWYSDLVRSSIEINTTVKEEFKKLFPDGYKQFSEDERAKIIYNYITSNFNYSHVSFRQSGFIPQKPSKTINTNLGDCKDFSTLFVTLAQMADLKSNLVLVLTSDYGRNNLVLPSTDFNHCIAKVMIDGKPQFLELTSKYLPYKSLPTSLRGATALEIPFDSENTNKKYDLIHLDNLQRIKSNVKNVVVLNAGDSNISLDITTSVRGHNVSYYDEVFSEPNKEVVKNSITDDFKAKLIDDFTLNKVSDFTKSNDGAKISYKSDLTINKKMNSIGSIKILQLPIISHPYENSIIQLDERNYPIDYLQYESVDSYTTEYSIELKENETFVEIPESKSFKFKNHNYSITYKNPQPNKLKVVINCDTPYDNIEPEDYADYKAYVKGVLDAELEYIGFK